MDNMRERMVVMEQNVTNVLLECSTEMDNMQQRMMVIKANFKNIIDMMGRVKD